ncbi:MAG: 50S ribosomal protein L22 [Pseudomonadota bacterium]
MRERDKAKVRKEARKAAPPSARLQNLKMSARKMRVMADMIRGKAVGEALALLAFTPRAAAGPLRKLLDSAVANADARGGYDLDKLVVKTVMVDAGAHIKRWMPRAMGRAFPIHKHTSHITVVLDEKK